MDDSVGKDLLQPGLAGTPVKARARYINLYDSDSDKSSLETPTKRRPECSERCVNLLDDTTSTCEHYSFCSDSSPSVNFNCSAEEHRGPVWIIFNDSGSNDCVESKNDDCDQENLSGKDGMLTYYNLRIIN